MESTLGADRPVHARWVVRLRGTVQGVGFRPAIHRLARAYGLAGFVRNEPDGLRVEVEGPPHRLDGFVAALPAAAPAAARIDASTVEPARPRGERRFRIVESGTREGIGGFGLVPPDLAPCPACLAEMRDPRDRRHGYPFLSCTACGPRFTVVRALPYDRARTTFEAFRLCPACRREYEDPTDRRFHAETTACPACGPRLAFIGPGGRCAMGDDAFAAALAVLDGGGILAVKGVGGFALACDATRDDAVAALRKRKRRPDKPFAVMARDLDHAARVVHLDDVVRRTLQSPARPIVLAPARRGAPLSPSIAPGLGDVGVFLPPSPLQQRLLDDGPALQVMTSGNASGEPLARDDREARRKLGEIADAFLLHDRPIAARADDSVVRVVGRGVVCVRRARGYVPSPLPLPFDGPPVLAVGGHAKNTVCLARAGQAVLSPHIGDLSHPEADALFVETVYDMLRLHGVEPAAVAHDLHPDYRSTRWARAAPWPAIGVAHHHAHVAACLVEHGRLGPVLGVAFDGTGYGPDGTLWGGELLRADLGSHRRLGHLLPLPLPGGEAAVREPWRLALAALHLAGEPVDPSAPIARIDERRRRAVERLLERDVACPRATGAGRWFDAVAALCGLVDGISYEGQAAARLEAVAVEGVTAPYGFEVGAFAAGGPLVVDLRPSVREIVADLRRRVDVGVVAGRFHETLAAAVVAMAVHARGEGEPGTVALTGGCFQNRLLTARARARLEAEGFEVLVHGRVPPNDGGLALGQAAIAAYGSGRAGRRATMVSSTSTSTTTSTGSGRCRRE